MPCHACSDAQLPSPSPPMTAVQDRCLRPMPHPCLRPLPACVFAPCHVTLAADGEVIHTRNGPEAHPALRDELQGRAFIVRTLERLGLNVETIKPVSRPSAPRWSGRHAQD
jgi:hypothetical protein